MEYQVWTKEEYEDKWSRVDCGDLPAAQREILEATKRGASPLLTAAIPFDFNIKIKEDKIGEAPKSKARTDKSAEAEGQGTAGPGDAKPAGKLDS